MAGGLLNQQSRHRRANRREPLGPGCPLACCLRLDACLFLAVRDPVESFWPPIWNGFVFRLAATYPYYSMLGYYPMTPGGILAPCF